MLQLGNKITVGEPIYKFQNNHSVDFDGVDDFIQLGEPISYTQHTISTWVKFTNETFSRVIFDARDSSEDGITIFVTSLEKITYRIGDGSGSELTSDSLTINEWHHIVATYDGTTQKLYINGALDQSATTSKEIDTTTNAKIGIVAYIDAAAFIGKIDELAIWDRALTAAEVTEIYRIKYGANLVQNGRFDELGSELVTNGDFATDSDWNKGTNWTISGGSATSDGTDATSNLSQSITSFTDKTFLVEGNASNVSQGFAYVSLGGTDTQIVVNSSGAFKHYVTISSGNSILYISGRNNFIGSIDNVSVKQVDPNDRWTLPTGASFADNKVVFTSATGSFYQSLQVFSEGTKIRVHFTVTNYSSGGIKPLLFGGDSSSGDTVISENGTFTQILTAGAGVNANFGFFLTSSNTSLELSNVMVEQQKYVATNLKLNSGNYKSADPVIVSTKSVDLDGTEEYLEVTKKDFLGTSDFTISLWIKPDTVTADNYFMGQYTDSNNRWYIRVRGTNSAIQFYSLNSSSQVINLEGGTPVANKWNHIAITADRDGSSKLYVNSVLSDTEGTSTASLTFTGNLEIGAFRLFNGYFDGTIDELGIFSSALSSDQVGELYNQGVPSNLSTHSANANLTGYWKMGDGTLDEAPLIADQTNATLGSELVTNGDYSNGLTGWTASNATLSIENSALKITSTGGNRPQAFQNVSDLVVGKTYKLSAVAKRGTTLNGVEIEIAGISSPTLSNKNTTNVFETIHYYFVATATTHTIQAKIDDGSEPEGTTAFFKSVSLKQVNGNPALMQNTPTIVTDAPLTKIRNYYRMGDGILDEIKNDGQSIFQNTNGVICDMIAPSLGAELITDGDFPAGTSAWDLGTGWELETGACVRSGHGVNSDFRQSISITANKLYKVSYTRFYESGHLTTNLFSDFETDGSNITLGRYNGNDVTITIDAYFMPTYTGTVLIRVFGINDWTGKITNVSVKEVNGAAGKMTNMRDTDITNDVPS